MLFVEVDPSDTHALSEGDTSDCVPHLGLSRSSVIVSGER